MTIPDAIARTVAATIVIAAGGTLVNLKVNDAKQDQRIERIEDLNNSVDGLREDLQRTDQTLARLNGELEGERVVPRDRPRS